MSRFKAGDRVVIVRTTAFHQYLGQVTTVIGVDICPEGPLFELDVPIPEPRLSVFPNFWATADQLEPCRDDGQDKSEWTEELRRLCGAKVSA